MIHYKPVSSSLVFISLFTITLLTLRSMVSGLNKIEKIQIRLARVRTAYFLNAGHLIDFSVRKLKTYGTWAAWQP